MSDPRPVRVTDAIDAATRALPPAPRDKAVEMTVSDLAPDESDRPEESPAGAPTPHATPADETSFALSPSEEAALHAAHTRTLPPPPETVRPARPLTWGATILVTLVTLIAAAATSALAVTGLFATRPWRAERSGILGDVIGALGLPLAAGVASAVAGLLAATLIGSLAALRATWWRVALPIACAVTPWLILVVTPLATSVGVLPLMAASAWTVFWLPVVAITIRTESRRSLPRVG